MNSAMRFVGIDPSLTGTGIAVVGADRKGRAKLLYSDRIEPPGAMRGVTRLMYLRQSLMDRLDKINAHSVCVEGYSFSSKFSRAHSLGEWGGVLRVTLAQDYRLPTFCLPPQSLKKFATGKGNTQGKAPMAVALNERLGATLSLGEDEVDAVWLALSLFDYHRYAGGEDLPQYAVEALEKLDTVFTPRTRRRK